MFLEILNDLLYKGQQLVLNSLNNVSNTLTIILPYSMYIFGRQEAAIDDSNFSLLLFFCLPIVTWLLIYFINSYANKKGKGSTLPIPHKRFTAVDDEGEVSVEMNRTQELILYMADLEDWIERKGLNR